MGLLPVGASRAATVITVNTATDSDGTCTVEECSLREAIEVANDLAGSDFIAFDIPGTPPPPIKVVAPLPTVYDPVVIDGTTQPGYSGAPIVEIDGSLLNEAGSYGDGLTVWADNSTIRGLVINRFGGGWGLAIQADRLPGGLGGDNVVVQNNYIGTTRTGTEAAGNFAGIVLNSTQNSLIGGSSADEANVISGNYDGINISPGAGTGTRIIGNLIGTDRTGNQAVGNTGQGIRLDGSGYAFGGAAPGEGNTVSGNTGDAFEIVTTNAFDNVIQGNRIGVGADGSPLPNESGVGVLFVAGAHDNLVGGTGDGEGNEIANNSSGGIKAYDGSGNRFVANSIHSNGGLGIDLLVSSSGGVTPNDPGDSDEGANNLQNHPMILGASLRNGLIEVSVGIESTSNSSFDIDVFDGRGCDPSGYGEGRFYLGSTTLTTGDAGQGSVGAGFAVGEASAHYVTATATDAAGNTSEFSRCFYVAGTDPDPSPTPSPSPPPPNSADVSVTQTIRHARRYFSQPGPVLEGNPEIPDRLWIFYEITNEGPATTDVVFRGPKGAFDYKRPGGGRYNFWTVPLDAQGSYEEGYKNCNFQNFVCRLRLRANRTYTYIIEVEANAPGPVTLSGSAWGEAPDPNTSNNRSETFDGRVNCKINGTSGRDRLVATPEPDSICGGAGNDRLTAVGPRDKIFGEGGNDVLMGRGDRRQSFLGGGGFDIANFQRERRSVTVALHVRTAGGRTAYSMEGAVGSRFGDYMTGLLGRDKLWGGPGNDRIAGRSARDRAWGGSGADRFITLDGDFDLVIGGPGYDLTQSDSGDSVRSATRTSGPPFYLDPL